jgi:hypothetical protein
MTEKVDLSEISAYNSKVDDMDFRFFNSVAALAVLMGSGACAFFAPAAWAGDRIDFSAPAIPLGVPQPDVEIKEPTKMLGRGDFANGFMGGAEMAAPAQYFIVKPKTREKDAWDLNPRLGDDPDQRHADDWSRPDPSRVTNSNTLNMKQGSNPNASGNQLQQRYDSGFDGGQNASKFGAQNGVNGDNSRSDARNGLDRDYSKYGAKNGLDRDYAKFRAQNGLDRDNARSFDRLGRLFSKADDDSFLTKSFSRDASGTDRFNAMRFTPSMSDGRVFNGGAFEDRMNTLGLGQDSGHPAVLPPFYAGHTPLDDVQSRQIGEQFGEGQMSFSAWEQPAASPVVPTRSFSNPDQINASRVVAPNPGVTLSIPQRPGDPH